MNRRSFLLSAAAGTATVAGSAAAYWRWQEIHPTILTPGRAEGHFLRNLSSSPNGLPPPSFEIKTDVAILGSGAAGLTAAWKLAKEGHRNFIVIDGPQPYGNAAGACLDGFACPTGAHYLPLPSPELKHVRELLYDLRILLRNPTAQQPVYDERFLLHAPEERLLVNGRWQEGLLPTNGVPQAELDEHARFFNAMAQLKASVGDDGRRAFAFPVMESSTDAQWRALDQLSLKGWLDQQGYRSPTLHWYLDYCCRDDYGSRYDQVSAWAGLHYFCSRHGEAENAAPGAWLTWPSGLEPLLAGLDRAAGHRRKSGTVVSVTPTASGLDIICVELIDGRPRTYRIKARNVICAMPLFVASRVLPTMRSSGFDPQQHLPDYAPWLVANFKLRRFPDESHRSLDGAPLSWDNVVYGGRGLGYVVSTHQDIRVTPPSSTVFSAYVALSDRTPEAARHWMESASPDELLDLAGADLRTAYGRQFARCVERVDITLRAHAMCTPRPGFRTNAGVQALRDTDGPVLFAHADLTGFSVFEEASWWGYRAALKLLR